MLLTLMKNKASRIIRTMRTEGSLAYCRRIVGLGRYRYFIKKFMGARKLQEDSTEVFNINFVLPSRKDGIVEELLMYQVHEPICTEIYLNFISYNDIVLDIGTNIGYYVACASTKISAEGMLIGFEPDPEVFQCAERNIIGIQHCNVTVFNKAISNSLGEIGFFVSKVANWGSIRPSSILSQQVEIKVKSITIDEFCCQNNISPSLIRMDIEGAEVEALLGAQKILKKHKPKLFIEFHPVLLSIDDQISFVDMLKGAGYSEFIVVDRYYDVPWSLKFARKSAVVTLNIDVIKNMIISSKIEKVISLFSC